MSTSIPWYWTASSAKLGPGRSPFTPRPPQPPAVGLRPPARGLGPQDRAPPPRAALPVPPPPPAPPGPRPPPRRRARPRGTQDGVARWKVALPFRADRILGEAGGHHP